MSSGRHSSSQKPIILRSGHPLCAIRPLVSFFFPSLSLFKARLRFTVSRFHLLHPFIARTRLITPHRSMLTIVYFNSSLTPAGPGDWLGGINIDDFEGQTIAERVVRAAHSIGADYISPTMTSGETPVDIVDPSQEGWIGFVNQTMVDVAHELGMGVKPWTAK